MPECFNFSLLSDLFKILKNYKNRETNKCIFDSISDTYYRENYHSDILAYYFSYELVRKKLLQWIIKSCKNRQFLKEENFPSYDLYTKNAIILREEGRRDITIYNSTKTHAVIIENKSNDAADMPKQLIRYITDLEENRKVTVDCIIYLNKNTLKEPTYSKEWTNEEIEKVKKLLLISQLTGNGSITTELINPVLLESQDIRLSALSMEIKTLFDNLINGGNSMNDIEFTELTSFLAKDNNKEELEKFVTAYNELPTKMRDFYYQYINEFKSSNDKFKYMKVGRWSSYVTFVDQLYINGINYGVDFAFTNSEIIISLLVRNPNDINKEMDSLKEMMKSDWVFASTHELDWGYKVEKKVNMYDVNEVKNLINTVLMSFENHLDKN